MQSELFGNMELDLRDYSRTVPVFAGYPDAGREKGPVKEIKASFF
jgi:hypothetical protein